MKSLPADVVGYKSTPTFTESTVPAGLLRRHSTKAGVWGRIRIEAGSLQYRILEPTLEVHELTPGTEGIVEPQVPHEVEPLGSVRFSVEFLRESPG